MSISETVGLPRGAELRLEQRADLPSFLGLSLKNGLLNIVTLTLYRFWGKTEVRRRVWSSTYLNDEPLEYTGRGVELFLGFLFALAVIGLPFLIVVFGAQFMGPLIASAIILPLYIGLIALIGFGMFTAFRYMASRTVWRGIRFQLEGSALRYGLSYLGYALLSGLTLGWFWPAAQRRLAAPLWSGLRFGDQALRFDLEAARRSPVYGAYAIAWVGILVTYLAFVSVMMSVMRGLLPEAGAQPGLSFIAAVYGLLFAFLPLFIVVIAPYQAAALRSVAAGIKFQNVSFRLDLKWTEMAWLMISNIVLVGVTLGFLTPFVQARTSKFLIGRVRTEGVADLSSVRQAERGPKTGEGLADAFGIAPI